MTAGLAAAILAGCGSSSDTTTTTIAAADTATSTAVSGASSGAATDAAAERLVESGWKGSIQPPPTSGPKATTGKTVWVTAIVGNEANSVLVKAFQEAGKALGWNVKVVDNKGDANTAITQIKQAVSAGADGIVEMPLDCAVVRSGLQVAKAAKIPVVNYAGLDCSAPESGGGPSLFAAPLKLFGTDNFADYYKVLGERDADQMLAVLASKGIKKPKIIQTQNLDLTLNATMAKAFQARIKEKCPGCTLYPLRFTLAQSAAGKSAQIFKSGILQHPDADALHFAWDNQLTTGGLRAAIQSAPQRFKLIFGGDGTSPSVDLARSNLADQVVVNKYPYEWYSWALADTLNRVFAGEKTSEMPNQGTMIFYVDKDHNMPADGQPVKYPIDYKAAYLKIWKGAAR